MQLASTSTFKPLFLLQQLFILVCGLFFCALGIVFDYRANMGLGPWDVLHQGISLHLPISFGQASIVVGLLIVLVGFAIGVKPGIGTVLNMILIGIFADWLLQTNWLVGLSDQPFWVRLLVSALGVLTTGLGTALYIAPRLGAGPRDGLMLRLHKLTKKRIAIVRAAIECLALLFGVLMGGTLGIGTLLFAFGIGPSVECCIYVLDRAKVPLLFKREFAQ